MYVVEARYMFTILSFQFCVDFVFQIAEMAKTKRLIELNEVKRWMTL